MMTGMSLGFSPDNVQEWGGAILTIAAVVAVVVGWLKWLRPKIRRASHEFRAARDAIVGREPIRDSITGREIEPALPGIGVRMSRNEDQLGILTEAVAKIADAVVRQDHIDARVDDIDDRVGRLEAASVERIAARAEGVALWHAVEAVANTEPAEQIESD